ncbi:hypothetical protein E1294_35450 [Nonomuraea diastatica]|uniref:ABC transporter permease n=2 Tax=Nonomuraea diastatica TaxID=1848329 RepID=A0A4R4W8M1_9ACTN|nr:hypothetical protein E1294_35450 [Nonomuraea diastatica]
MRTSLPGYVAIGRMQARTVMRYRVDYGAGLVRLLFQILLLRVVWEGLYAGRTMVDGISFSLTITYLTLGNLQNWLFSPWIFSLIPERVRDGLVGIDLTRPVGFLGQVVASQLGRTAAMAPFAVVALPFASFVGGAQPSTSPAAIIAYVVSLALGYCVITILSVLVGLITFWTLELEGLFLIYRMAVQFLSGALVPLWFMPDALRIVVEVLPLQAVMHTPTAIYLGRIHSGDVAIAMAVQALWVVVLWFAARLVWSRAIRRMIVQGG